MISLFSKKMVPSVASVGLFCLTASVSVLCADPAFDFRGQTRDKIKTPYGTVRQGSFGPPSINDKGVVAYTCIVTGTNVTAFTNNTVVVRRPGKKPPAVALRAGVYPVGTVRSVNWESGFYPVTGNSSEETENPRMYRIGKSVAINNKRRVAFAGQMLYETVKTNTNGSTTTTHDQISVIGELLPWGGFSKFNASPLQLFLSFKESILAKTASISASGVVAYNAQTQVSEDNFVDSLNFSSPYNYMGTFATVQSPVIGLPFNTTFQTFSEVVIADNRAFLVADISDTGDDFDGIWQGKNSDLSPVVVKNAKVPGGGQFSAFNALVGPSPNAKICSFVADVTDGKFTRGAFRVKTSGDDLIKVAAVGDTAPGNTTSGKLGKFTDVTQTGANIRGQVAVLAKVTVDSTERSGIWLSDRAGGNLTLIAVEGQSIPVTKKVTKEISNIAFNPVAGLNRKGEVCFTASFTDRTSAVIVATLK